MCINLPTPLAKILFFNHTDKTEVKDIAMCLNLPKTIGKNSIVQLLVNNVSYQLTFPILMVYMN